MTKEELTNTAGARRDMAIIAKEAKTQIELIFARDCQGHREELLLLY